MTDQTNEPKDVKGLIPNIMGSIRKAELASIRSQLEPMVRGLLNHKKEG